MENESLHLDFETRSRIPLDVRGLDNYAKDPSTSVLLCAYAFGDRAPKLWQPHLDPKIPADLEDALNDPFSTAYAWNSAFEQAICRHVLKIDKPIHEFRDPMVSSRYMSMPGSLDAAGEILGLGSEAAKLKSGKRLIQLFCSPEDEGGEENLFGVSEPTFRDWRTDPAEWLLFGKYCVQDVIAERAIFKKLQKFPVPDSEWETWVLSEKINGRGVPTDQVLVSGARTIVVQEMERLTAELKERTGLDNANSVSQLLPWLQARGYVFSSLGKPFVARAFAGEGNLSEEARAVLEIRNQTAKSSVKKYTVIADLASEDGRLRNQYTFYGAARTGRWAAHGANVNNFSKPSKAVEKKMERAIELVRLGDYKTILAEFGKPLDVIASTIRSSFRAPEGSRFVVCDLNAIENRLLGWVSNCDKILDVFRRTFTYEGPDYPEKDIYNGNTYPVDPYLDFATRMYGQSYHDLWVEWKIKGDATKRNNAKAPVLGAGYQLGPGEERMDAEGNPFFTGLLGYARALGVEMTSEEAKLAIQVFRDTYSEVTWYWKDIHNAAVRAVKNPGQLVGVGVPHTDKDREYYAKIEHPLTWEPKISFLCHGSKVLEMKLPSGRSLHYINPEVRQEDATYQNRTYKKNTLYYHGKEQGSQTWGECVASPGRFTENSVQAIARDVLVNGMKLADSKGFEIVLHVYDEIGTLVPNSSPLTLEDLAECMAVSPSWAPDLPLTAEGYENIYYKK